MPNAFAYLVVLLWPIVTVVLFKKLEVERAIIWSLLGAYMILPRGTGWDLPLVPALEKTSIPNITIFLICLLMLKKRIPLFPESLIGKVLIVLFIVSPVATILTNREPIYFNVGGLPGLRIYDSVSAVINQAIFILPFFVARSLLNTEKAQREMLLALVLGGLAYSLPILLEVRLSPQLNVWFYGFFPSDFMQQIRFGGFRPVVFMGHGLLVAHFVMLSVLATYGMWRRDLSKRRGHYFWAALYMSFIMVVCKSVGSTLYAIAAVPLILFTGIRTQIQIAAVLAAIAVTYPILRGADLVPVDDMLAKAEAFDPGRAQSLEFRFNNEEILLEHAQEKPVFGWGLWGRNEVYDPNTGRSLTVTDGRWIIVLGIFGWVGYIVEFGLLALPVFALMIQARRHRKTGISPYAGVLALSLGLNMVDLLPNASLTPFTWLTAGALLGYAEALRAGRVPTGDQAMQGAPPEPEPGPRGNRPKLAYARQHEKRGTQTRQPPGRRSRTPYTRQDLPRPGE